MATQTESKTLEVLKSMALENTGTHMLDSGGAYGRNWERNQVNGVTTEPEADLEIRVWSNDDISLEATLNVVPWLEGCLEYDDELDADWLDFDLGYEDKYTGYMQVVEDWIAERFPEGVTGMYGGREGGTWVNSYNSEDALSQVIQFYAFTVPDYDGHEYFSHVALQIHGGCDVRGGYTKPRIFRCYDEMWSILDYHRVGIVCQDGHRGADHPDQMTLDGAPAQVPCRAGWVSENGGYSFGIDMAEGCSADVELNEYPMELGEQGEIGKIVVIDAGDDKHIAKCPKCGTGTLVATPY